MTGGDLYAAMRGRRVRGLHAAETDLALWPNLAHQVVAGDKKTAVRSHGQRDGLA